jgi:Tfp pilus assembly protein PilV
MRKPRGQRGTTLIEAMIAMVVIAIGGVGIIGAHVQQLRQNNAAREITISTALAQDLVENMSLWDWNDTRLTAGSHAESDLGTSYTGLSSRTGFARAWTVSVPAGGTRADITVTVTGPSGGQVTMYTVRANRSITGI